MNPKAMLAASIWHFRHDEGFVGQVIQIVAGLALWSLFGYVTLKFIIMCYEAGKGDEQRLEIDREAEGGPFLSEMGWYRRFFCLRVSVSAAFIIEGLRFGGGWPTILLIGLGCGCWYGLSPERGWMRHSR